MRKVKIAVIDTYVDLRNSGFDVESVHISEYSQNYNIENFLHGTMVCSQIISEYSNVDITVFPVFSSENEIIDTIEILDVLKYIYENEDFNLINMSFGMLDCEYLEELSDICNALVDRGTIIVSAFDNDGALSYPAVLDCVIGIDMISEKQSQGGYHYIKNSIINIRGDGKIRRIKCGNKFILARGTSFIVPIFTGKLARFIFESDFNYDLDLIKSFLELNAAKTEKIDEYDIPEYQFEIKNAIVIPVNKENHSLMRFRNILPFNILGFYDFKYQLNIGKPISSFTGNFEDVEVIKNIDSIDWTADFDTVILGHVDTIVSLAGEEIILSLLKKCIEFNKKIIAYDDYIDKKFKKKKEYLKELKLFYPKIEKNMVPNGRFGKLWFIRKPILEVLGTRSQLGKFTAQIKIINRIEDKGYKVGFLSSEPTGMFYNAKYVFPYGFNSSVNLCLEDYIPVINEMLHRLDVEGNDIIVTGGQSGTLPYDFINTSRILLPQISYLYATNPDGVILCVSCDDELEYIKRNILFIESSCDTTVLGIVLFPIEKQINYLGVYSDVNVENQLTYKEKQEILFNKFKIPVFTFSDDSINDCVDYILKYFTKET